MYFLSARLGLCALLSVAASCDRVLPLGAPRAVVDLGAADTPVEPDAARPDVAAPDLQGPDGAMGPDGPASADLSSLIGQPFGQVTKASVSSNYSDEDPSLTADRLLLCFTSNRAGGAGSKDIWCASRGPTTAWSDPQPQVEVNSWGDDFAPRLSADGKTLFFSRWESPGPVIYRSQRASRQVPWGAPELVQLTPASQGFPGQPANNGQQLAFTATLSSSNWEIHLGQQGSSVASYTVAPLAGVNSSARDKDPWISDDLRVLYFTVNAASGAGSIVRAVRPDAQSSFEPPVEVAGLGSWTVIEDPWLSPDLRVIYYAAFTATGWDIFRAER